MRNYGSVIFFSWLRLLNVILTTYNLQGRSWQLVNVCPMCHREEESVQYLFSDCQFVKELRKYIYDVLRQHNSPNIAYKELNQRLVLDNESCMKWRRVEITTCFVI
jgi:zinc-binding in reverse transcriptase